MLSLFSQIPSGEHSPPYKGPFSPIRFLLLPIIIYILDPHSPSIKVTFLCPDRIHYIHLFRLANPYLQLDNANSPASAVSKAAKSNLQHLTNPYLEKFSNNTSQAAAQPMHMSRPVYLCEEHRKQRIMIQVQNLIILVLMQIICLRDINEVPKYEHVNALDCNLDRI